MLIGGNHRHRRTRQAKQGAQRISSRAARGKRASQPVETLSVHQFAPSGRCIGAMRWIWSGT
jgi:hypothetical protein